MVENNLNFVNQNVNTNITQRSHRFVDNTKIVDVSNNSKNQSISTDLGIKSDVSHKRDNNRNIETLNRAMLH